MKRRNTKTTKGRRTTERSSRAKKRRPRRFKRPQTAADLVALSERQQGHWSDTTRVVSLMRANGLSLRAAAQSVGVSSRVVTTRAGSALKRRKNGRYAVSARDRLLRVLVIPTADGLQEIAVRDSRHATRVAEYWNAVHRYLARGDASMLATFEGEAITNGAGVTIPLLTDRTQLDRLAGAGVLSFETIYARSA